MTRSERDDSCLLTSRRSGCPDPGTRVFCSHLRLEDKTGCAPPDIYPSPRPFHSTHSLSPTFGALQSVPRLGGEGGEGEREEGKTFPCSAPSRFTNSFASNLPFYRRPPALLERHPLNLRQPLAENPVSSQNYTLLHCALLFHCFTSKKRFRPTRGAMEGLAMALHYTPTCPNQHASLQFRHRTPAARQSKFDDQHSPRHSPSLSRPPYPCHRIPGLALFPPSRPTEYGPARPLLQSTPEQAAIVPCRPRRHFRSQ